MARHPLPPAERGPMWFEPQQLHLPIQANAWVPAAHWGRFVGPWGTLAPNAWVGAAGTTLHPLL